VIEAKGEFGRASGLDHCARAGDYKDSDILVSTDVDVQTPQDVIDDSRRYVLLGKRSYFYLGGGAWNIQATGLSAIAFGDYRRVGGYDIYKYRNRYGFEDTDLFYRLRLGRVMPVRFQHPGLKHVDHERLAGWGNSGAVNTPHGEFHNCKGCGGPQPHHCKAHR